MFISSRVDFVIGINDKHPVISAIYDSLGLHLFTEARGGMIIREA